MQLTFSDARATWEATTAPGEGDVPKAAGLKWDSAYGCWQTYDVRQAAHLRSYADEADQAKLDAALEIENDRDPESAERARLASVAVAVAEIRLARRRKAAEVERVAAEARKAGREVAREVARAERQAEVIARGLSQKARLSDSLERAAADLAGTAAPRDEERAEILAGLKFLAAADADGATLRNGEGFNKTDSYHGHELASREALDDDEARVGRELVRRYRGQLEGRVSVPMSTETPVVEAVPMVPAAEKRAILGCIRILARRGSPEASQAACVDLAGRQELSDAEALAGRQIIRSRRMEFPASAKVVDLALGTVPEAMVDPEAGDRVLVHMGLPADQVPVAPEVISVLVGTETPTRDAPIFEAFQRETVARVCEAMGIPGARPATPAPVARRGRGRPTKASQGGEILSQVERTRRWRAARKTATLEMPGAVAERIRALREARGVSTETLLAAALDALERAGAQKVGVN